MQLLVFFSLYAIASLTDAEPIRGCSGVKGNYFVGDRQNPCVYYWCEDGNFLQWVFPCSRGSAVPYGYFGQIVPCIDNRRACQGGAPTAALIRDPELDHNVYFHTTTRYPYPTQSALDDDIPTLSHKAKQLPTMGPQWYDTGVKGRQGQDTREPNWEGGDMGKGNKDTMEPNWEGGDKEHKKDSNKVEMGGSSAPDTKSTTTPYQVTKSASTTPGTTRQVPSTIGGHLFSSVFPQTDKPTLGGHDEEGRRGHGGSSTPDAQIGDRRTLPSGSVEDSSPEGVRHSTVVPMSENDMSHTGEEESTMRPDKDALEHTDIPSSKRPNGDTMFPTRQPSPSTPGFVMSTDGFVKVVSSTATAPPLTSSTTTSTTTTSTHPPTTTTTTRRTTTSTSTTPRLTTRTTPSTTSPPRTTTTTPITIPDDDDFDFFGFETQGGPTGNVDSLPRVIDHGEGDGEEDGEEEEEREQEEEIRPTQEATTPNATTRGLPEFLRTTQPALPKTARTQPPLPTTPATTTTQVPTTTTTQPSSTTSTTVRTTTTQVPTTTTERPTTTAAPTADPCDEKMPMRGGGQVITQVFPQHHIVGGERRANFTFQIGVIHVTLEIKMASMCYLACDLHPGCAGFDWDIEDKSCWFHTEERECTSTVTYMGGAIAHYRLEACGTVSDTDSPKSKETLGAGIDGSKPGGEQRPADQFVSQLTSGSEPAADVISPFPNNLQADKMAGYEDGTLRDPGRRDDFEHGQLMRVFNMIIDHGRNRKRDDESEEETESEWVHGS